MSWSLPLVRERWGTVAMTLVTASVLLPDVVLCPNMLLLRVLLTGPATRGRASVGILCE